jgi:hypothetical protein
MVRVFPDKDLLKSDTLISFYTLRPDLHKMTARLPGGMQVC